MTFPFEPGSSSWTGPALTEEMVLQAEASLGVKLPQGYLDLMRQSNGGVLKDGCFPTSFRTSWAADHFQVDVLLGIGDEQGADAQSANLVREWDYPDIGVVIGVTALAGPDTVMLDYSSCGPEGEPAVAYVGQDRVPHRVAESFTAFINGLVSCEAYEDETFRARAVEAPEDFGLS